MLALGFEVALFKYLGSGPKYPTDAVDPSCRYNWWLNLLYVQNLFRTDQQCFGHAWYLANDMQFFLLTPMLVLPFHYSRLAGLIVNAIALIGTGIAPTVITYVNNLPASTPSSIVYFKRNIPFDSEFYGKYIYEAPYCRLGPYIVGILLGYILYTTNRRVKIHKVVLFLGWTLAAVLAMSVLYGLYGEVRGNFLPRWASALYAGFHRDAWALALAWVVFACSTGYGGLVNNILSMKCLVPLSRLSYMAYLIHPAIMFYYYTSLQQPLVITVISMVYIFLGHLVVTYALAALFSLAFEAPMIRIEKVLLGNRHSL